MEHQDPDVRSRSHLSNSSHHHHSLEPPALFSRSADSSTTATTASPDPRAAARHNVPVELDAEDFYKGYQQNHHHHHRDVLPAAAPAASNGAASTTRHIGLLSTRTLPTTNPKLMSAPGAGTGGRLPSGNISVKDLKKRFDQPQDELIPPPRAPTRPSAPAVAKQDSAGALRSRHTSNPRVRTDGASEKTDNPQSFANRMQNSNRSDNPNLHIIQQQTAAVASSAAPGPLLFGEIRPGQDDSMRAGHGIEVVKPEYPSDYNLPELDAPRMNYDDDPEPASPSQWYRSAEPQQLPTEENNHTPAQSHAQTATPAKPTSHTETTSPTSKLPLPTRRLQTAPNASASTDASLGTAKPPLPPSVPTGAARPPSRAKTPTARAKTPTHQNRERKAHPTSINSTRQGNSSASLPTKSPTTGTRPRQPVTIATTASSRMRESERARNKTQEGSSRRRLVSIGPVDFEQRREHIRLAYTRSIRESQAFEAKQKAADRREQEAEQTAAVELSASRSSQRFELPASKSSQRFELPASKSAQRIPAELPASKSSELMPGGNDRSTARDSMQSNSSQLSATSRLLKRRSRSTSERKGIAEGLAATLSISTALASSNRTGVSRSAKSSPALELPGSFPTPSSSDLNEPPHSATSAVTEFDIEPQIGIDEQDESTTSMPLAVGKRTEDTSDAHLQESTQREEAEERDATSYYRRHEQKASDATIAPISNLPPSISLEFTDDFEESLSLGPPAPTFNNYSTTVTIISDSLPQTAVPSRETSTIQPSVLDESDCYSELENGTDISQSGRRGSDDANTDACTEETDNHSRNDEARHGLNDHDSQRASTCASSDMGGMFDDITNTTYEQRLHDHTVLSLPPYGARPDRFSRQSGWTEYSEMSDVARQSTRSTRESIQNDSAFHQYQSHSTHDFSEVDDSSRQSLLNPDQDGLGTSGSVSGSALESRASSIFYDQPLDSSTHGNSERDSDGVLSHSITPQSIDTGSVEIAEQDQIKTPVLDLNSKPLPPIVDEEAVKAKRRLVQRRNVIKELVDTEAIFVRDMSIVEEIYKGTAEACPKLDDQTVKLIFRNTNEIVEFHTVFLAELKEAVTPIYIPKGSRKTQMQTPTADTNGIPKLELTPEADREVFIGPLFARHIENMKNVHEVFLRNSDQAVKRLVQIQQDATVKVWLSECNEVAKDLTAAWDLDSLLIKPMQRITKYPNLILTMLQHTSQDHPDREALVTAKDIVESSILEINKTKKNFELVGQIVGRKRRDSDVKTGLARAFGKRVDKLQTAGVRPIEDSDYDKLKEKFGDDYLRLQVVLRDVEFYTRQVSEYCHEFLQYLSSIELVMRLQPGAYPELESKWVQFNISMRDLEKVVLDEHLTQVRKNVIEPFEQVIKAYGNPSLAMKKREKRRGDYERAEQLRRGGKTLDSKLREQVEQYEALNDALKTELPKLSQLTEKVGNICLGNLVNIQTNWYKIWTDKMKMVVTNCADIPDINEIVATFQADFPYAAEQVANIGILNPAYRGRISQSTSTSTDEHQFRHRSRTVDGDRRGRGMSMNDDSTSSLPVFDSSKRHSGSAAMSPNLSSSGVGSSTAAAPSPHQYYYRDYYTSAHGTASASPKSTDASSGLRSTFGTGVASTRPSTSRSGDSTAITRQSVDSTAHKQESGNPSTVSYMSQESNRFSNMFHSALPDGQGEINRTSQSSVHELGDTSSGYTVLWLAASLFEFNISTTKHEAGYPYLTYQAGEIFDVIAEKGELWLAKNQDDHTQQVGWIWSKHFARLADS